MFRLCQPTILAVVGVVFLFVELSLSGQTSGLALTPTPTVSDGATGQIAYRDGIGLIVADAGNTKLHKITDDSKGVYFCPAWSRDGKQIAVIGGNDGFELYTISGTGGNPKTIIKKGALTGDFPGGSPTWSPDGKQIAFIGQDTPGFFISSTDGKTKNAVQSIKFADIAWSLDGKKMVGFAQDKDGSNGIFTVKIDGTDLTKLLALPQSDWDTTLDTNHYFTRSVIAPQWSADGTQIIFASTKDDPKGLLQLYTMNADGSSVQPVKAANSDSSNSYAPTWSPDGKYLAFVSDRDNDKGVYVLALGKGTVRLLADFSEGGCPTWNPAVSKK